MPNTEIMENEVDNVIDLDLSVTKRKRFRINKDNDKILELNTSDINILVRLEETMPKLKELQIQSSEISEDDDHASIIQSLKDVDAKMREYVDYIFNSNVSETCASDGTMYDPINGQFRYEYIINALLALYESNITEETKKMQKRLEKHTGKYSKK